MKAVVAEGPRTASVQEVEEPRVDGRALVAVRGAGICGTDLKVFNAAVPIEYPRILGHEIVGTVVVAGERGLVREGKRVLIDPVTFCGHCVECLADRTHLCSSGALMGREIDGGFAEFVAVNERQLHVLPDALPEDEAVLLQVLGTCVHAQTLVDVFPGQTAAVIGLGVSGMLHLQLLLERGLRQIVGVTRTGWKRELAKTLGAAAVAAPEEAGRVIEDVTGGRGADLVVESVGKVATLAQSVEFAAPGGMVLAFGTITEIAGELPFYQLYLKELTLVNPRAARPRDYARAVQLAAEGRLKLRPLLSRTYPLQEAPSVLGGGSDLGALKITFKVS